MWIHGLIFLCFVILFIFSRGLFSKASHFISRRLPSIYSIEEKYIKLFLMLLFWCNILGFLLTAASYLQEDTVAAGYLVRPKQGEEVYEEELIVSDGSNKEKVTIEVEQAPYTKAEIEEYFADAKEYIEENFLGENTDPMKIEHPVNLMTTIPDSPVTISWDTDQPLYLDWEGNLGADIPKEGIAVKLQAVLVLQEQTNLYEKEVYVYPEKLSENQTFSKEVEEKLDQTKAQEGEYQYLPSEINGKEVTWTKLPDTTGLALTVFVAIIGILLLLCVQSRKKQEEKDRLEKLRIDYPNLINKLILLMQAGASSRRAFRKIALDYKYTLEQGGKRRPAYDEFLRTYYEMEQGIPEEGAYARLGERCALMEYKTLATLLIQNLKKGGARFLDTLQAECVRAFEERKKRALIQGEVAGTKLLLPMMGMLLIVLMILMVPSFMAF